MKIKLLSIILFTLLLFSGCKENKTVDNSKNDYLYFSKRDDQATVGIKMIPITIPIDKFNMMISNIISRV